jgi:hypothetical protein
VTSQFQSHRLHRTRFPRDFLRGESHDLPIPVHIQKEPPFWDVFPENPAIFNLVVQARSLNILRLEENRHLKEKVVRYTRQTAIGLENVDVASSWEETAQVLEILLAGMIGKKFSVRLRQSWTLLQQKRTSDRFTKC